jgi:nucleoside-diphosphate-sugar epimerase
VSCAAPFDPARRDAQMRDANVAGTQRIIDACLAAKVGRLVHTSSVVAIGLTRTATPADETTPFNFADVDPAVRRVHPDQARIRRSRARGGEPARQVITRVHVWPA